MFRTITASILVCALVSCNNESETGTKTSDSTVADTQTATMNNTLTDAQKGEGWQLLFDGQSLGSWHKYGNEPVGAAWKVVDGTITLDTSSKKDGKVVGGGDIVTNEEFENFHLKLEWRISLGGNSGIMFYVHEDSTKYKNTYHTGPEMQVLDNNGHNDAKFPKHRAGDLYDLISSSKETVRPVGEWNQVEIKALNGKLDFWLNGENIVSTTLWDDNWKQMVANSKFKQWPDFGTYKKGRIALQDHDNLVSYRNIMIRRL